MKPRAERIDLTIGLLKGLSIPLNASESQLRAQGTMESPGFEWRMAFPNTDLWTRQACADACARMQTLIREDLETPTTMRLLSVTRYCFELKVWLRSISKDRRFSHVYAGQVIRDQIRSNRDLESHLLRESQWFEKLGHDEAALHSEHVRSALFIADETKRNEALGSVFDSVSLEIDERAARRFSIYGDDARFNGYGFQAFLIETKVLPEIRARLVALEAIHALFTERAALDVSAVLGKSEKWQWRTRAENVGMEHEYDFIYGYTSRLLHATPSSMTTRMQALDDGEILSFLRYVLVCAQDILEIGQTLSAGVA